MVEKSVREERGVFSETASLLSATASGIGAGDGVQVKTNGTFVGSRESTSDGGATGDTENGSTNGSPEDGPKIKVNMVTLLPALAIGVFLVALDTTLTIACYGKMGSDLKALNSTSWIATSYYLTLTTFQPFYGKLTDIFGRRECLLFAYTVFGLGCLFCGISQNIMQLCISRAVAGIGGGGMNAVVSILVTDLVSLRDRGIWQGYINMIFSAGMACGAPLGGLLADSIGWRWAFAAQFPMAIMAFVAVFCVLDLPKKEDSHWSNKLIRIDFIGAFTLTVATFLLLWGFDNGSNEGWNKKITIIPLALSPFFFALFIFIEKKVASEPFAPGHIILDPPLLAAYLANFFGVAAQMGILFFVALFYQAALGFNATQSGLMFIPATISGLLGSLGGGFLMRRTGKYYWLTINGYLILLLSILPMVLFTGFVAKSATGVVVGVTVLAFGSGISITSTLIAIIANSPEEDVAVAIACSYLFRSLGTTFGISISTAVLQQVLRLELSARLNDGGKATEIEEQVRQSLDYIRQLPPQVADIIRDCYAVATEYAFIPVVAFAIVCILATCFIREKKLDR